MSPSYDVVLATDARLPGGTSASVAEEIRAQAVAGYRTALLHVPSPLVSRDRPFAPRLRACLERGEAQLLVDDGPVTTQLLVLRHPTVAASIDPGAVPRITAERTLLVANQAPQARVVPVSGPGPGPAAGAEVAWYRPREVTAHLEAWLATPVRWVPIGPLVREELLRADADLELEPEDWVNVIDVDAWRQRRTGVRHRVPVIGRHSRDSALKWPADRASLLAAYPDTEVEVHILGGAASAARLLGGALPDNWLVLPFGAVPPARFLAGLDVYVYHHHPAWVEAFGRSILEAMASGLPTVLPARFAPLFADAAVYAAPDEVRDVVRALHGDPAEYRARSTRAVEFVRERFGHGTHHDRLAVLATPSAHDSSAAVPAAGTSARGSSTAVPAAGAGGAPSAETRDVAVRGHDPQPGRILFVSSNGAGVGHLMRLLAYARHAPAHLEPIFLTFSQGGQVVEEQGHLVEYLASRSISGASAVAWHPMLRERVAGLIGRYDVRAVVFDGTWPYQGLMDAVADHAGVSLVWSRRAMWRAGVTNPVVEGERDRFDLVVEPGELAADDDRGVTRPLRREATRVAPVTFLEFEELLAPEEARAALDLDPDRPAALVTLGAGNIDAVDGVLRRVLARLGTAPELQVLVTRSIIAEQQDALPANVRPLSIYPLARYLRAFDLAVAAAGYNSFHELTLAAVPTVFVPNLVTATDDQVARAVYAERIGIGVALPDPDDAGIARALGLILDPDRRRRMHERAAARRRGGGAVAAMAAIVEAAERGPQERVPPLARAARVAPTAHPGGVVSAAHTDGVPVRPASRADGVPVQPASRADGTVVQAAAPPSLRAGRARRWRRRIARLAQDARVRNRVGWLFARLPTEVRRSVRRRLRRWDRRRSSADAQQRTPLPVPAGWVLPAEDRAGASLSLAPVLIVVPPLGDAAQVDRVVERIAALQRARGGFAPLLVLGDLAFRAARRCGYLVEVLPSADLQTQRRTTESWEQVHAERIAMLIRWYAPSRVLTLPPPGPEGDLTHLLAVLAAGLEGLERPSG